LKSRLILCDNVWSCLIMCDKGQVVKQCLINIKV
jgi:hypothetical protein